MQDYNKPIGTNWTCPFCHNTEVITEIGINHRCDNTYIIHSLEDIIGMREFGDKWMKRFLYKEPEVVDLKLSTYTIEGSDIIDLRKHPQEVMLNAKFAKYNEILENQHNELISLAGIGLAKYLENNKTYPKKLTEETLNKFINELNRNKHSK